MILAAAGDVDHDRIVRLAEGLFGDMAPAGAAAPQAAAYSGGERRVVKPLEQAHMALALPAPSFLDKGYYAAQILAVVLGGGMSSRLFQEARENRGLCYTIFAQCAAWSDAGMMTIYAGTGGEELPELINLTADELNRAARDLGEAEVARARAQTKAGLLMWLESVSAPGRAPGGDAVGLGPDPAAGGDRRADRRGRRAANARRRSASARRAPVAGALRSGRAGGPDRRLDRTAGGLSRCSPGATEPIPSFRPTV